MSRSTILKRSSAILAASLLLVAAAGPAFAADPTIDQIHAKAVSGDIQGALTMMEPVLKDHPNSAKAHYVEAELLAHAHRTGEARAELAKAQQIAPGLPGIKPQSVSQLNAELNLTAGTGVAAPIPAPSGIHWGPIVIIGLAVFALMAMLRRRSAPAYAQGGGAAVYPAGMTGAAGPGYGPGSGGMPMGGGGMGSGLMGGLASGLAMGAGVAVGEEVIGHMFGSHQGGMGGMGGDVADPNANMGGDDFGISDAGSWDDGGSGGGDGGW